MTFSKSVLPLGDGRVCHARYGGGATEFLCASDGGIVIKRIDAGGRAVKTSGAVSFADGAVFCGDKLLELVAGELK